MRTALAIIALTVATSASAQDVVDAPCAAGIEPRSYRLVTRAQALNVHRPRYDWWDAFDLGAHAEALEDMMGASTALAERALAIDPGNRLAKSQLARLFLVHGDGDAAEPYWKDVMQAGGSVVWTGTLYDVDARTYFVLAFDRERIRIYRFDQLARQVRRGRGGIPEFPPAEDDAFWAAMGGCIDDAIAPEASVPWSDVREIKAGNWVLWFKLRRPVSIASDRNGRRKTLEEIKVNLHGRTGDLEVYKPVGDDHLALRGRGPAGYQDLVRRTLVKFVDPERRIALPPSKPGAGW